ncbi:MAG: transcription elongation GreA/GreB family factor [Polaribacter sp.]|jgi:transcription elongation GreA/GreB family factor
MDKLQIKESLIEQCTEYIQERMDIAEKMMDSAQESANDDTKSSAGDKFETGRAMMSIERDNHAQQLSKAIFIKSQLDQINADSIYDKVTFGAVVKTSLGNYFIAIAAGRIKVEEEKFFAISPQAPLAKEMLQKSVGETLVFNDSEIKILDIF